MKLDRTLKLGVTRTVRPHGQALSCGFTLIELLLAVAIFAIVLMAINTVFYSGLRLERSTTRALDERVGLNQALAILRRDLQGAVPPNSNGVFICDFRSGATLSGSLGGTMGAGKGSAIEFCTTTGVIKDEVPWGDLQRVRYELVQTADRTTRGMDLVRTITRNLLPTTTEESDTQWLMGNVESLEFLTCDGSSWRNSWDTTMGDTGLPTAVRTRVLLANTNLANNNSFTREPLELLVPLVVQARTNTTATSTGGGQ
jgi:type II secretion system protein J